MPTEDSTLYHSGLELLAGYNFLQESLPTIALVRIRIANQDRKIVTGQGCVIAPVYCFFISIDNFIIFRLLA